MSRHKAAFVYGVEPNGWIRVQFPYDAAYIRALKLAVPTAARSWNDDTKTWAIAPIYQQRLDASFTNVEDSRRHNAGRQHANVPPATPPAKPTKPVTLEDALAQVFQLLPDNLRTAAHRALLRAVHPDTGGDHDVTVALNAAWRKAS